MSLCRNRRGIRKGSWLWTGTVRPLLFLELIQRLFQELHQFFLFLAQCFKFLIQGLRLLRPFGKFLREFVRSLIEFLLETAENLQFGQWRNYRLSP